MSGSIHPQGWVPIETSRSNRNNSNAFNVAFTPKGGCPLKPTIWLMLKYVLPIVAFTPKGGCPLKRVGYAVVDAALRDE